jgi:hypothetical protein
MKSAPTIPFKKGNWETLSGAALAKAILVTGENRLDYARKFGSKTVFIRDCGGVQRLRAVGNDGLVYQLKVYTGMAATGNTKELDISAAALARAAETGFWDLLVWSIYRVNLVNTATI